MSDFDTWDMVRHIPTGVVYQVACVHDTVLYTVGIPSRTLQIRDCELQAKATREQMMAALKQAAERESMQHRTMCARQRLNEMAQE